MTDLDIQKPRHLLKHFEERMIFLGNIMSQIDGNTSRIGRIASQVGDLASESDNLSLQAAFVASELKKTLDSIGNHYKEMNDDTEEL